MLKYLIQVVQNGLGAAILTALLGAFVWKAPRLKRFFLGGLWAGLGAALVLAVLRRTTALINREYVNTAVLSVSMIAVLLFMAFAALRGARAAGIQDRALPPLSAILVFTLLFYALPTIFLYPAEFLLAGQTVFSTDFLFRLIGFLAGGGLVLLSALGLFNTGNNSRSFLLHILLFVCLAVNMVLQLSGIVQVLLVRNIVKFPRWVFRVLVQVINNNSLFLFALMALSIVIPVLLFAVSFKKEGPFANPAVARKFKALMRDYRRWSLCAVLCFAAALLILTVAKTYNEQGVTLSPAEDLTRLDGELLIPIEQIEDGHLHRFAYTAEGGIEMRFIVIKKTGAAYGVGLDACDICGPTGYYERKGQVICRLCDVVMNISTIGFKGGCNPVPLAYALRQGFMVIREADLEQEKNRFAQ